VFEVAFIKFKPIATQFHFFEMVEKQDLDNEVLKYIDESEKIILAVKSRRDYGIFTDKRVVLIDKKGIRGFRQSIYAIKYDSISTYVLNIHNFDSTIEIITSGAHMIKVDFLKPIPLDNIYVIYKYLTDYIIKS
jgi:hypothetical protein